MATGRVMGRANVPGLVWSVVLAGIAVLLALAGTVVPIPAAHADPEPGLPLVPMTVNAVPLEQAGEIVMWGDNSVGQVTVPDSLDGVAVSQVALGVSVSLAVTAAGRVVGWGGDGARLQQIPEVVANADVAQVAIGNTGGGWAGAVTRDGRVLTWGQRTNLPSPLDVPANLTGVKQLVMNFRTAVALKNDGSVVAWGDPDSGINEVPDGLKATAIFITAYVAYALTEDGTVVAWGNDVNATNLPAAVQVPGNVKSLAAWGFGGLAMLADHTLIGWGGSFNIGGPSTETPGSTTAFPASVLSATPVAVAANGSYDLGIVDDQGIIRIWSQTSGPLYPITPAPDELNGRPISQFGVGYPGGFAVVTKMLRGAAPTLSGTPAVGGTLTATPGTFSASPGSVTGQWFAGGEPVSGATDTTLTLTSAQAGKQITYRSTAAKAGETTISSSSEAVTVPNAATINVSAAAGRYGKASAVTVTVPGATGNVTVTVDGRSIGTKTLASGRASFSVVKTTKPGNHALKATYSAATKTAILVVGKGATGKPALRVSASHKKRGTVRVSIATSAGLVKATGKAQLVLKKGKSTKKVNLNVRNGKATGKLPKLAKGTWKAYVVYKGSTYYVAVKSRTIKVKSK